MTTTLDPTPRAVPYLTVPRDLNLTDRAFLAARRLTWGRPHLLIVLAALVAFAGAYTGAFLLRFDFRVPPRHLQYLVATLPFVVLAKVLAFYALGVFHIVWAYVGIRDALVILRTTVFASAGTAATNLLLLPSATIPRSILLLDGLLTFIAVSGLYAGLRMAREARAHARRPDSPPQPVFIVGANDAGEALLRELQREQSPGVRPVGFLDDAADRIGLSLRGLRVLGPTSDAKVLTQRHGARQAYIAMPRVEGSELRRIVSRLTEARLAIKILPPPAQLAGVSSFVPQLREVSIEDLLRRAPIHIDDDAKSKFVQDKVVLVTGAAGSIGSELCRQLLAFSPARLVALDCAETPLHDLTLEFESRVRSGLVVPELAEITDHAAVTRVFSRHRPQVVFHAAALKHVPMLEAHTERALRVNVTGTRIVAEAAGRCADALVMVSTDKAVNPTSVMGTSKRIAEMLVREYDRRSATTRYTSVRFGNVLGSNGSVLSIFRRQLAQGGPLTVTHAKMRRYFMMISEAVELVLEAAMLGKGGEIFVLDMGEPIRIVDLAEDLIRLSGLRPGVDIRIEFTGPRPGEKLFEAWAMESERLSATAHPQVHVIRSGQPSAPLEEIARLEQMVFSGAARSAILEQMKRLVPEYQPETPTEGPGSPLEHAAADGIEQPLRAVSLGAHSANPRGGT